MSQPLKRVVVKISGSLFDRPPSPKKIRDTANVFKAASSEMGIQFIVITGGGILAREYISAGRALEMDESALDQVGIEATRMNARLFLAALYPDVYPLIPTTLDEVIAAVELRKHVVCGGLQPGHSTNAVAALIAERMRADLLLNATDVDGVYTRDPKKGGESQKLAVITTSQLRKLLDEGKMIAGSYELLDLVALKIIERARLPTRIIKNEPEIIWEVLKGKQHGTLITAD